MSLQSCCFAGAVSCDTFSQNYSLWKFLKFMEFQEPWKRDGRRPNADPPLADRTADEFVRPVHAVHSGSAQSPASKRDEQRPGEPPKREGTAPLLAIGSWVLLA